MTTVIEQLLAQKEEYLRRLDDDDLGADERADIEATLKNLFTALGLFGDAGRGDAA